MIKTFKIGGIHLAENKIADRKIELLDLPRSVCMPLSQHIGVPAQAVVERGQHVDRGQEIAKNAAYVSANIHTPITGTVTSVENVVMPNGKSAPAIMIKASEEEHLSDTEARNSYWKSIVPGVTDRDLCDRLSVEFIREAIRGAGIVGLGGATFPSHVKLSTKSIDHPDVLILNGCECEPYLMCDDALMSTYPARIVEGVELMMKAANVDRAIIAIEDNKPEAIKAVSAHLDPRYDITVQPVRTKYPQGGEKQLVEALTGRRIAYGALPISVGAIVNNVATAFAVWQTIETGVPLIERVVTVTGDIPSGQRKNYMVALGSPIFQLPFTLPSEARVIVGGPMMGRTAVCLDAPITKGTSGVTILKGVGRRAVSPCVRCATCVDVCPMGLEPYLLASYGRLRMWDEARLADVADCLECGSCSWACPSSQPLLDYIRIAKQRSKK